MAELTLFGVSVSLIGRSYLMSGGVMAGPSRYLPIFSAAGHVRPVVLRLYFQDIDKGIQTAEIHFTHRSRLYRNM